MKNYKIVINATGAINVSARDIQSAFNKGVKLEGKLRKILNDNSFECTQIACKYVKEIEDE